MALERDASSLSENFLVVGKETTYLAHRTESRIVLKTRQQEKVYPPTDVSVSL